MAWLVEGLPRRHRAVALYTSTASMRSMRQHDTGLNIIPAPEQEGQVFKVSLGYKMPIIRNKQTNKQKTISLRGSRVFKEKGEMPVSCSIPQVQMFSVGYVWSVGCVWWLMPLIPAFGG